ncbi:hypothetical protein LCGC14_0607830 [marine sediment metagenome]|uniref:Uncharacterized protein n=1 Tax=marine sediment metagenome TaxID=412755 RepID=A0A0F9TUX9_9ZZZZ
MSNKALFDLATTLNRRKVEVEEWKSEIECIYIREMTALEMEKFTTKTYKMKKGVMQAKPMEAMWAILAICAVQQDGEPLFTLVEWKNIPGSMVLRLGMIAFEVNDLDDESTIKKAAEDLKKVQNGNLSTS